MSEHEDQAGMPLLQQFKQQMLKAWQPVPSLTKTIIMFFILSAIFLGLGIPMIILSQDISEFSIRYDNQCEIGQQCVLNFQVASSMTGPVFVYYQLNNYYQNHRLYANSLSTKQLLGESISSSDAESDCQPIVYNRDIYVTTSINGTPLNESAIANPCGVIAYTLFNDTFQLELSGNNISILDTGIAWPSDISRYKNGNEAEMWTNVQSERFMNWMRIAAMPQFRKLWGKIQNQLQAGNYSLQITNNYNVSGFGGQKYFVVSQSNFFGSKNDFLSITYIVVGSLCLIAAIGFLVKKLLKNRSESLEIS